jgi:hypothetical protein
MGQIVTLVHDTSETDRLDEAFAAKRHAEAYATRAAARAVVVKRAGVAALLGGLGVGAALFGASFLLQPKERVVTLPGAEHVTERIIEKQVPGPERIVAVTPTEKHFIDSPAFAAADIKGRIIPSVDGRALSFDSGKNWYPTDVGKAADSRALVGDFGYCSPTADKTIYHCFASHNGAIVDVPQRPREGRPT